MDCPDSEEQNRKVWSMYVYPGLVEVDISNKNDFKDKNTFVIKKSTLNYGTYMVCLEVYMYKEVDGKQVFPPIGIKFETQVCTYLKVVPTPIVAGLASLAANNMDKPFGRSFILDAKKYSLDPDHPDDKVIISLCSTSISLIAYQVYSSQ